MKIFVVRHGETLYNSRKQIQGHIDVPLSPNGIKQARHTAAFLAALTDGHRPAAVYSSDLKRARSTAEPFLEMMTTGANLPVVYTEKLREINLGDWQGKTRDQLKKDRGAHGVSLFELWLKYPEFLIPPGAESMPDFYARCTSVLNEIINRYNSPGAVVAVFTHSGVLSMMKNHIKGNTLNRFKKYSFPNAGGITISYNGTGRSKVTTLNPAQKPKP